MDERSEMYGGDSRSAGDMRSLRRLLKAAKTGCGEIACAIEACTFPLTERGFTMLIVSCRRHGRWRKAMEIFEVMKGSVTMSAGVKPNFYTYSSLVSVCSAAGACSQGLQVLKEMRGCAKELPEIKPDAEVYEALITACYRRRRWRDVIYLHDLMVQDDVNRSSRNALLYALEACGELGVWKKGMDVLDMLIGMQVEVSGDMYQTLLSCCADRGDLHSAVELFLTMQMAGDVPDPVACHHMVRAAAAAPNPGMCLDLLDDMRDMDILIDVATYKCVLTMLNRNGFWEIANDVLNRMQAQEDKSPSRRSKSSLKF